MFLTNNNKANHLAPWSGHPKGLAFLLGTEMCERFAFYIVQGLLVLYVVHFMGWKDKHSYQLAGAYTALLYISPLLGGYLADHFIGQSRSLIIGGICMLIGYLSLVIGNEITMHISLGCIVLGNGLYKPNVATLVGNLYPHDTAKRESGYTLFLIGFNIGVFIATSTVGFVKMYFGWNASFILAAMGMIVGVIVFIYGRKYIIDSFDIAQLKKPDQQQTIAWLCLIPVFIITILISSALLYWSSIANMFFIFLGICLFVAILYIITKHKGHEKNKLILLLILLCVSIVFWSLYFQEFFSVTLFIDRTVNRTYSNITLPPILFLSLEALFIILVGPWFAKKLQNPDSFNSSMLTKFIYALIASAIAYATLAIATLFPDNAHLLHPYNVILYFLFLTIGELLLYPIGMAAVIQLAPQKMQGFMMGAWFFTLGIGGSISGLLGEFANIGAAADISIPAEVNTYQHAFVIYSAIAIGCALLIILLRPIAFKKLGDTLDL